MKTLVSILLPVYNGERFLSEAILSVRNQTFKSWELLIINDGSTDSSAEIAMEFSNMDERVKVFEKEHSGVAKSLNFGLNKAAGELIARIDSDDLWFPEKLEYQVDLLKGNPDLFLMGTSVIMIDETGLSLAVQKGFNNRLPFSSKGIRRNLLKNNLFCHSSVMFRRDLISNIGMYHEGFKNSEDYEYWIRAAKKVSCEISGRVLVKYRVWSNAVSFKKREQQIYYSFRARLRGLFTLGCIPLNLFFLLKFIGNSIVYLLKKGVNHLKQL